MKTYVVFKGKGTRLIKQLQTIPDIIVTFSSNGWMNDTLTSDYLKKIIGQLSFNKRLLIWDAYKCHTSEATKAELGKLKVDTAVIPGGCSNLSKHLTFLGTHVSSLIFVAVMMSGCLLLVLTNIQEAVI